MQARSATTAIVKSPKSKRAIREPQKLATTFWAQDEAEKPENWDFRKIREDQLDAAILYEYARHSDWVLTAFKKWHGQVFRPPKNNQTLTKWAGWTVVQFIRRTETEE